MKMEGSCYAMRILKFRYEVLFVLGVDSSRTTAEEILDPEVYRRLRDQSVEEPENVLEYETRECLWFSSDMHQGRAPVPRNRLEDIPHYYDMPRLR